MPSGPLVSTLIDPFPQQVEPLEWIRHSDPDSAPNLLCVYMGPKYELPAGVAPIRTKQKRAVVSKKPTRIMVDSPPSVTSSIAEGSAPSRPPASGMSASLLVSIFVLLSPTDIKINALYDPRLLYDYGGPVFDHRLSKLKQRNIVDQTNTLVPPWDEYSELRPGTVVLMKISLHTYTITNDNGRLRKVRSPCRSRPTVWLTPT